jgi:hypothetical protein
MIIVELKSKSHQVIQVLRESVKDKDRNRSSNDLRTELEKLRQEVYTLRVSMQTVLYVIYNVDQKIKHNAASYLMVFSYQLGCFRKITSIPV